MKNRMIFKRTCIIVILLLTILSVNCKPFNTDANTIPMGEHDANCHGFLCPSNAKYCKKTTKTSTDKTALEINIHCIGNYNQILDQTNYVVMNPHPEGPRVKMLSMNGFVKIPIKPRY